MRTSQPGPPGQATAARWLQWLPMVGLAGILVLVALTPGAASGMALTYSRFTADVGAGTVRAVTIDPLGRVTGSLTSGQPFTTTIPVALDDRALPGQLAAHHVQVSATAAAPSSARPVLIGLLLLVLLGGLFYIAVRGVRRQAPGLSGLSGAANLTKAKARIIDAERPTTRFADVAGYAAVKTEVGDVVDYLRDPGRYRAAGARGPRGVPCTGSPRPCSNRKPSAATRSAQSSRPHALLLREPARRPGHQRSLRIQLVNSRHSNTARADATSMETIPVRHQPPAPCGPPRRPTSLVASLPATAGRRSRKHAARIVLVMVATAALAGAAVTGWGALAASVALLGHLAWIWIPAAIVLESASMAALSGMQRRLLAAGGVNVGIRSMLATTFAANALSVSVPLAGPELGTVFTFRRFTRQGADAPLASWSLLVGGVVATAAGVLVVVGGGLSSGNLPATVAAAAVGLVAVAALAAAVAAARRPRMRGTLESLAARTLRFWRRLKRRSAEDPGQTVRAWADRLGSLRLPVSGWTAVTGLALGNWLADAAVLAVSIHAAGAAVPWHALLLAYGSGVAAQNLNLTPGGFGITEGALGLTLAAAGLRPGQALAAVLLYRLVSFWLVAAAGWLIFLWLRRHRSLNRRRDVGRSAADGGSARHERAADAAGDAAGQGSPGTLRWHELMLLHGQPGSEADWQLVTARLPAQLRVVAADRPGYGSNPRPAAGFAANARAVLHELDARGIQRAVLVGHSYGGGVALATAHLAPHRVEAVVLLASVGPGCVNRWDRLLAAPGAGPLCALVAWRLTPWVARVRLALITWLRNRPLTPDEHVNWQVWAHVSRGHGALWRTFLTEQRALMRELDDLVAGLPSVQAPVLLLADPADRLVPFDTARRLARALPDARLQLVAGAGHHLPRRAPDAVADAIAAFMAATDFAETLS